MHRQLFMYYQNVISLWCYAFLLTKISKLALQPIVTKSLSFQELKCWKCKMLFLLQAHITTVLHTAARFSLYTASILFLTTVNHQTWPDRSSVGTWVGCLTVFTVNTVLYLFRILENIISFKNDKSLILMS